MARPAVIRLLDYLATSLTLGVRGGKGSRFTLDGLLVTGRGLVVQGPETEFRDGSRANPGDLCDITIRHCTLVPGWGLHCDCDPTPPVRAEHGSDEYHRAKIKIQHSILGAIEVIADAAATDPIESSK